MIIAAFYLGPFSGKRLVLPEPFLQYVIPQFEPIQLEHFYLRAGELDENLWSYLFDDSFGSLVP